MFGGNEAEVIGNCGGSRRGQSDCDAVASLALVAICSCLRLQRGGASRRADDAFLYRPGRLQYAARHCARRCRHRSIQSGGLLDFAVLEQNPNTSLYQVEIFHGKSDGTFTMNASSDLFPLAPGVIGNAITAGPFHGPGPLDIAVATNTGIVILQNSGSGTFAPPSNAISSLNGFASLAVGQFDGTGNYGIAAVSPAVNGIVSFTVFSGNGNGGFTPSSTYSVSSGYVQCSAILQGSFQGLTNAADLALVCNTLYEEEVLVYLNLGHGTFGLYQTLDAGQRVVGVSTGVAVGTLNSRPAIFISPPAGSFTSYQFVNYAFTSVSMVPVGLAPRGSLALLSPNWRGGGLRHERFRGRHQHFHRVHAERNFPKRDLEFDGNPGASRKLWQPEFRRLLEGPTYIVVDAGVHTGTYPASPPSPAILSLISMNIRSPYFS